MNCVELQQVLPEMIDSENSELQAHLISCPDCSDLVAELELIASESRQLADGDDPPQRVWAKIAAELRAEGVIRDTETAPARPVPLRNSPRWRNAWWLIPVAAAMIAAGSYFIKPKPAAPVAHNDNPATVSTPESTAPAQSVTAASNDHPAATPNVSKSKNNDNGNTETIGPDDQAPMMTASTADQRFLDGVSPEMRSEYESQLKAVNSYIRDAQNYLKQNPGDEDARQHLMGAYEQKEMLYQMALDHVQ